MAQSDDQRGHAWIATISALIVIASFVAGKAARDAILLARFDVRTLPIFIAISAVISLPIIFVAGRLMARWGPVRLIPALNVASAALSVAEWLLIRRAPQPIAVVVFFHLATSGAVLASGFWSIVNERFDVQTAKRHIARIGIGATLGGIFGGVIAERAAVYLAPDAILLVLAGLQLVSAVALWMFGRGARHEAGARPVGPWVGLGVASRSPLLRRLGAIVVLGAVAAGVLDYVFKADIVHASSHDGLLRSLAIFYTVTSVITAIVQVVLCGPLIARLGVPRSVGTLPATLTAFSLFALIVPIPAVAALARGAELVTRNSLFRAGYELIYAPLPEDQKRPAKVILDVGADRIGDLFGAQLVALIVYASAAPRLGLLTAALCVGVVAMVFALRLPRSYTRALEDSLLAHASESPPAPPPADEAQPWVTLDGLPRLGQAGEIAPLSLRIRDRKRRQHPRPSPSPPSPPPPDSAPAAGPGADRTLDTIADLRSGDPARIHRALDCELTPELAVHAVDLIGRDDVARPALAALGGVARRCTGMLVDALLDQRRPVEVRRRLPGVLLSGEPAHATWGLWRALADPSFDVRYRSGAVLSRLAADGHLRGVTTDDVFDAVRRELTAREALARHRVFDDIAAEHHRSAGSAGTGGSAGSAGSEPGAELHRASAGLEHVFTVLGLVLPAEPLRIALHAVQTDDPELRGTALEYLESILPADVRAQLWPLLEGDLSPGSKASFPAVTAEAELAAEAGLAAEAELAAGSGGPVGRAAIDRADAAAVDAADIELPPAARLIATPRAPRSHDEIVAALRLSYPRIVDRLRQRMKSA
jgi:hypothetical protein